MKSYPGNRRRAPALSSPERAFWAAFGRSMRSSGRRRARRSLYGFLRRL